MGQNVFSVTIGPCHEQQMSSISSASSRVALWHACCLWKRRDGLFTVNCRVTVYLFVAAVTELA